MPAFSLKVQSAKTSLDPRFKDVSFIEEKLKARMQATADEIQEKISNAVEAAVRKSRVYKALVNPPIGTIGYDLPAEFGLRPGEAEEAAELMVDIVKNTVEVNAAGVFTEYKTTNPVLSCKFSISFMNPNKYMNKLIRKPFWYTARKQYRKKAPTSYKIDWMRWILNANEGDNAIYGTLPSVKEYGISYTESTKALRWSRSGRALMRKDRNHSMYGLPEVVKPRRGADNFLEEISRDPSFAKDLDKRVKSVIDKRLILKK
jgi:hypothetical protein